MTRVLVSNNSELLRHLSAPTLRRLGLDISVMASGREVVDAARARPPAMAILDAEMPELSGYDAAAQIKADVPGCKVIVVLGKRIGAGQMQRVARSGCDEVLIAPMSADELYDAVAIQLGLARRGSEAYHVAVAVADDTGDGRPIETRVTNLSIDGARLLTDEALAEGTRLVFTITTDAADHPGEDAPMVIAARVVWSQQAGPETVIGASFEDLDGATRDRLARLVHWEIVADTERTRVVIKGDITEATSFDDLLPLLVGRVDFDLSQVRYINSLGVRTWIEFLRAAKIQGYEFHACSIAFVLQASLIDDMVGRGTITSFFAPYHCEGCDRQDERLLQSAAILASESHEPPAFTCAACGGAVVLDDLPDRYLAFLRGPAAGDK